MKEIGVLKKKIEIANSVTQDPDEYHTLVCNALLDFIDNEEIEKVFNGERR